MNNEQQTFTVTATATYFVEAGDKDEASSIVHEAMLGNDPQNILGNGEVHYKMLIQKGFHSLIDHD